MRRFWTGLGLALVAGGAVLAAESAPPAPMVDPSQAKTVEQIEQYYDRQLVQAIGAFIKRSKPTDPELDKAYMALFNKVIEHDWYAQAQAEAEQYLKTYPKGQARPYAQIIQTRALADRGKFDQAEAVFKELLGSLDASDQKEFATNFGLDLAQRAVTAGKVDAARSIDQALLKKFPDDAQLKEAIQGELAKVQLIGKAPPAIVAQDVNGKPVNLADYKGKLTLVDFWATWCGPCVAELPTVKQVYDKYSGKGFDILGISLDEKAQDVKEFVQSKDVHWRQVLNGQGAKDIAQAYGVTAIPSSFLIGPDGKILRVGLRGENLGKAVESLLSSTKAK